MANSSDEGFTVEAGWRMWLGRTRVLVRTLRLFWKFMFDKPAHTRPRGKVPVVRMTRGGLLAAPDRTLWRLGHSTVLMKLRGEFFLTDPVFAERASPVWFAGPRRFHAAPISLKELPPIKAVVISHDHYDHLDKRTIRKLAKKSELFVAPRGVGEHLRLWGVDAAKVRELDWWEETEIGGVRFAATPTQHFSGRSLWNRNETLWVSYVILDGDLRVFYGADSGYFEGFATIGEKYGPFDVTLLENGAYNVRWPVIHMQPEETVRAHRDLRGQWLIPIHNGTFDLALHPWTEPMERVQELAGRHGIQVCTPRFGEAVLLTEMGSGTCWWRGVDGVENSELATAPVSKLAR
jgi:L-ascorbate metabolism protein UlaG (beta-lactamase superfamily)